MATPLHRLSALGQSVWIDSLSRETNRDGDLAELIADHAVVGATSNPTIFQKAMAGGAHYDEQLRELLEQTQDTREIFWTLAEQDIREACDLFAPTFEETAHRDGYVSVEVAPDLAYDTLGSYREAMRLHRDIDKPNLMVKIPATKPGLGAIEDAIAAGRSINITLIFSLQRYAEVAESYLRGLQRLVAAGGDPTKVASVASFFVSRIDTEADRRLEDVGAPQALHGKLGVANARLAYQHYREVFSGDRWDQLAAKGATPQRVLWASTSVKNPAYPDTMYIDELIGPDTVNTMPLETIHAFEDHGSAKPRLEVDIEGAHRVFEDLERAGVDYDDVTDTLEREGVEKFEASFAELLQGLRAKQQSLTPA